MRNSVTALAVTILAFALRLFHLGDQSLWYDEAHSLLMSQKDPGSIISATAQDTMPPLSYLLLHLWSVPAGDFYVRFPSAFFSTLCVPLVYGLALTLFQNYYPVYARGIALLAALITALSPFQLYFAQEVRMYSLLAFLTLLSVSSLVHAGKKSGLGWWALYTIATTLALYTHGLAALVLLSPAVAAAIYFRETGSFAKKLAQWTALSLLAFASWGLVLVQQSTTVLGSFWVSPPSVVSPVASLYIFLYGASLPRYLLPFGLFLSISAAVLSTYLWLRRNGILVLMRQRQPETFLLLWAGLPIAMLYLISLVRPLYLERVVIGASFPWYIGLALISSRSYLRFRVKLALSRITIPSPASLWPALLLRAMIITLALVGLGNWYFNPSYAKPPLKEAAMYIREYGTGSDVIFHTSDGSYLPFRVYLPGHSNLLLYGDPEFFEWTARARSTYGALGVEPTELDDALARRGRLWLVVALDHSQAFQLEAAQDVHDRLHLVEEQNIRGILVRLYEPRR